MRRIFTLLLLLGLLVSFRPAYAQGGPSLSSAEVWIWPEYDKPDVLVIQHLIVSPQTTLPVTMTLRIPAAAQQPHALAVGQTSDTVADTPYTLEVDGKWVKVSFEVTGRAVQLEYYDPSLSKNGTKREFSYEWAGDYAVENFHVELQQPFDASAMSMEPALSTVNPVPDGLMYYTGDFGALAAGQSFTLNMSYTKESDALSVSFMNVQPSAPVDEDTAGRVSLDTYVPWLVGAFGVLMIAGGFYYFLRGSARQRPNARRRRVAREEPAEGQTYCPQCGTRARSGDRFCRTCGTRLRTETEE
ncbi:MAG: zinc ribbon domain-containing protein [Anaerolineaceae bacterium]|nr:MAG: zinc ribbon domain-containing protein [Anaerolineaceae bacterium]